MLRSFGSKQPSALGLAVEHPLQTCDSKQAGLEGQYAQTHNVTVTRLDHYLLFHDLQEQQMLERGGRREREAQEKGQEPGGGEERKK